MDQAKLLCLERNDQLLEQPVEHAQFTDLLVVGLFGAAIIGFDRFVFPTLLSVDRQKAIICEMVEKGLLEASAVPEGICS